MNSIRLNRDNIFRDMFIPCDMRGNEIAMAIVPQNEHKIYVLRLLEDGDQYLDVRSWTKYGKEKDFGPSKQGFHIKMSIFKDKMKGYLDEMCSLDVKTLNK